MTETVANDQVLTTDSVSAAVSTEALAQDALMNASAPQSQATVPPLEGAADHRVNKPVSLGQLEAELRAAAGLGPDAHYAVVLTGPDNTAEPISETNEAQLWVIPASLDDALVAQTIAVHTPRPDWGIPAAQLAYNVVWEKVIADPEVKLTPTEVRNLVVGLALRLNAQEAVSSGTA